MTTKSQHGSRQPAVMAIGLLLFFLIFRQGLDFYWRDLNPYYSYLFELIFVGFSLKYYWPNLSWRLESSRVTGVSFVSSAVGGFLIYRLAGYIGLQIPFDLNDRELIFLLLVVAPILEEFIFRLALWEPLVHLFKKPAFVAVTSTGLFSIGHFSSLFSVPVEFRNFVLYQTFYVILLGLFLSWRRLVGKSVLPPILYHFGFNLGFFLAGK